MGRAAFGIASILALMLLWPNVVRAADRLSYFSISLVAPRTRQLTPLVIYENGGIVYQKRVPMTRGATLFVKLRGPVGEYVSVVFRDDADQQFDLPYKARRIDSEVKQFYWTMPQRFVEGNVDVYLQLWTIYNAETRSMDGGHAATGWITLGSTSI